MKNLSEGWEHLLQWQSEIKVSIWVLANSYGWKIKATCCCIRFYNCEKKNVYADIKETIMTRYSSTSFYVNSFVIIKYWILANVNVWRDSFGQNFIFLIIEDGNLKGYMKFRLNQWIKLQGGKFCRTPPSPQNLL